ncbi:MAG TPA: hypothetical protein VGO93_16740 [Candidatus Xenobia bacterium]|jgi:hypothetical protein
MTIAVYLTLTDVERLERIRKHYDCGTDQAVRLGIECLANRIEHALEPSRYAETAACDDCGTERHYRDLTNVNGRSVCLVNCGQAVQS